MAHLQCFCTRGYSSDWGWWWTMFGLVLPLYLLGSPNPPPRVLLCCPCPAGLLQPVSQAHLGVVSSQHASSTAAAINGTCNGCASSSSSIGSSSISSSSSQARGASSSCGPPPGFANGTLPTSSKTAAGAPSQQQRQQQHTQQQGPHQQQQQQVQQRWGELRLPMQLGHPPADTAVFAPLMAALQELQVRTLSTPPP